MQVLIHGHPSRWRFRHRQDAETRKSVASNISQEKLEMPSFLLLKELGLFISPGPGSGRIKATSAKQRCLLGSGACGLMGLSEAGSSLGKIEMASLILICKCYRHSASPCSL